MEKVKELFPLMPYVIAVCFGKVWSLQDMFLEVIQLFMSKSHSDKN